MNKNHKNIEDLEKKTSTKAKKRSRKKYKKPKMKVSGKSVLKLKKIIEDK